MFLLKGTRQNDSQSKFSPPLLTNDFALLSTNGYVLEKVRFAAVKGIICDRDGD